MNTGRSSEIRKHKTVQFPNPQRQCKIRERGYKKGAMAVSIIEPTDDMVKEVFASDSSLKGVSMNEKSQSTWQMILQYKTAMFRSTFIGLGAFN
jgi:hypothetical protein